MPNSEVVLELAEEFLERYRQGERPPLQEYIDRRPDLASEIREVFPAMAMMEKIAIADASLDRSTTRGKSDEPLALQQIGDYRIIREVGRGGMGIVFEAEQVSLGRHVALKVLPRNALVDKRQKHRFEREAKAAAKLHHTNIVPVFGVGDHDGMPYYVMQFIQGLGLDDVLAELRRMNRAKDYPETESASHAHSSVHAVARSMMTGEFRPGADLTRAEPLSDESENHPETESHSSATLSLSASSLSLPGQGAASRATARKASYWQSVANVGLQVADALEYAHKQGILHRDIKPSNLLLDMRGAVWVTDFGLAKANDHQDLTHTGDIVGTLRYMPPEAFEGKADVRSDVFALGLTLFELLALQPAFPEKDRNKLLKQVTSQDAPRLDRVTPAVPRDLVTIVHKAADRDPARRYQSAGELAADLQRFLADEPIRARRTSPAERLSRWCRRNPTVACLSATVVLLLGAVAIVSSVLAIRLNAALHATRKAQADATDKLWNSYLSQAAARRLSHQPGQRFASLRAIEEALKLPVPAGRSRDELRNEAIAALLLPDLETDREWDGYPLGASGFAIDPAFERYARGDQAGNIVLCCLGSNDALFKIPGRGIISSYGGMEFSPDGQFMHQHFQHGNDVAGGRLWKLSGTDPVLVLDEHHCGFSFEPKGRRCATAHLDGTIRVYETATGRELRQYSGLAGLAGPFQLAWNPAKPEWLLVRGISASRVLDLESGQLMPGGPTLAEGYSWVDWHPQGRLLAVCGQDRKIYLWDVVAGRNVFPPFDVHKNNGVVCRFNHAGDRLLSTDWNNVWRLWDVHTGQLLLSMPAGGVNLQFSADDRVVATDILAPRARMFRCRSGSELRTLLPLSRSTPNGYLNRGLPVLHRDGRLLAIAARDGIDVIDLLRGEELGHLPAPGDGPLTFEADGSLLTCGASGVLRWPLRQSSPTEWRYAAPELIVRTRFVMHAHGSSRDAQTVGIPDRTAAVVWHRADKTRVRLGQQDDVRDCAISPDGQWAATGTFALREGPGAKVWDARTGRHEADLPAGAQCHVHFSPDGRWLLTTGGGCRIWHVGTWQEGPGLHADPTNAEGAFSHDGRLLALGDAPGVVRLVEPDTGRELARLTTPEPTRLVPCCFTPDGSTLVTFGTESEAVHLFDLRAIRQQLAEMGLDWDAPPIPAPSTVVPEPLRITAPSSDEFRRWRQVHDSIHEAQQQRHAGKYAEMFRLLRRAVAADPDNPTASNELAWNLVTGPEVMQEPKEALTLARKAVAAEPNRALFENTLGVALYRNGKFTEAVQMLEKSLRDGNDGSDAFDLFFLAMCHHRLGDAARARDCRERAGHWVEARHGKLSKTWADELAAFQAEADSVLAGPAGSGK